MFSQHDQALIKVATDVAAKYICLTNLTYTPLTAYAIVYRNSRTDDEIAQAMRELKVQILLLMLDSCDGIYTDLKIRYKIEEDYNEFCKISDNALKRLVL